MAKNLGYEIKGASTLATGKFFASRFVIPDNGILESFSVYLFNDSGSPQNVQVGIYEDISGVMSKRLISSTTFALPIGFDDWRTLSLTESLELGSAYWLAIQFENSAVGVYLYYDEGIEGQGAFAAAWSFGTWPDDPPGLTYSTNKISVYATYAPVVPGAYTWSLQSKSQIDPEKVEEAIARLILEHNEDETAHLGAGQSLQSHKAATIIDHVVDSVVADKLADQSLSLKKFTGNQYVISSCFESVDGWNSKQYLGAGGYTLGIFGTKIYTDNNPGSATFLATVPDTTEYVLDFAKSPFFQTSLRINSSVNSGGTFRCGGSKRFGFKIENGVLYAQTDDDVVETTTEIPGIDTTKYNIYRAVFDSVGGTIKYYVNGVLKVTHTENLPTGNDDYLFSYGINNLGYVLREMWIRDFLWCQDK